MFNWFKPKRSDPTVLPPPEDPAARCEWVKARQRAWQGCWHDFFDADETLAKTGEFVRPDPLPDDLDRDTRLIFGLSRSTPATREACFSIMPEGPEMGRRFERFMIGKVSAMSEEDARAGLAKLIAYIQELGPNEDVDFTKVSIVDRDTEDGLNALRETDDMTILLEGNPRLQHPQEALINGAAEMFLTEPLFVSAGNYYHLGDWVTAALFGGKVDAFQSQRYALWEGGWQVMLSDEGVVLARRAV